MNFGIKYCGGCNPQYDRVEIATKIKSYTNNEHIVEIVKEGNVYDILIILCGCHCACANHKDIKVIYKKICVTCERDYENLLLIIDKIKFQPNLKG
ncbi:hypothetical protein [Clostridium sp.]|uniref:hypothetical protein n=1 Tax=Clostridium sp. TaxID=1506 RepID=UPI002FCB0BFE